VTFDGFIFYHMSYGSDTTNWVYILSYELWLLRDYGSRYI